MEVKKIIPYRIKQARVSRGLSILELAERLDVTKQAISQYELGKTEPSKAVLNLLSSVLKYPVSFFYRPALSEKSADSGVFFRSGKTAQKKSQHVAIEKMKLFGEINEFLRQYISFPVVNLPKCEYPEYFDFIDWASIEERALALREYWGLGLAPINNLLRIMEKNGIIISSMRLGLSKIEGFSLWHNNYPFIFICSDKDCNARTRFSASHELAHILLHADIFSDDELRDRELHKRLEIEANTFAGAFLLPKESFSKDVYSTSIDHFIQLKSKWKTSISAMINRCETLNLLSVSQIKYLNDQMTKRGYWHREPLDDTMPIEKPVAHKQAVELLLDNNIITAYDFMEGTGVSLSELEEYCFLKKGTLAAVEKSNIINLRLV